MLNTGRDGWRKFVDALYAANSDLPLPPREMVIGISVDVVPGNEFPVFTFELIGLRMPVPVMKELRSDD